MARKYKPPHFAILVAHRGRSQDPAWPLCSDDTAHYPHRTRLRPGPLGSIREPQRDTPAASGRGAGQLPTGRPSPAEAAPGLVQEREKPSSLAAPLAASACDGYPEEDQAPTAACAPIWSVPSRWTGIRAGASSAPGPPALPGRASRPNGRAAAPRLGGYGSAPRRVRAQSLAS